MLASFLLVHIEGRKFWEFHKYHVVFQKLFLKNLLNKRRFYLLSTLQWVFNLKSSPHRWCSPLKSYATCCHRWYRTVSLTNPYHSPKTNPMLILTETKSQIRNQIRFQTRWMTRAMVPTCRGSNTLANFWDWQTDTRSTNGSFGSGVSARISLSSSCSYVFFERCSSVCSIASTMAFWTCVWLDRSRADSLSRNKNIHALPSTKNGTLISYRNF